MSEELPQPVAILVQSDEGPIILVQPGYRGAESIEVEGVTYRVVVAPFKAFWGAP